MFRKVSSIICYVISGFFLYTLCFISFNKIIDSLEAKIWIYGFFLVPALVLFLAGLWLRRFDNWKRDLGILFLASSGFTALAVSSFFLILHDPGYAKLLPEGKTMPNLVEDYVTGTVLLAVLSSLGGLLLWSSGKKVPAEAKTEDLHG